MDKPAMAEKQQPERPQQVRQAGSKILAEVIRRVDVEKAMTATWSQNWNAHGNHNNHMS
jgi:hypothetical protein